MHNILGDYIHRKRNSYNLSLRKFAAKCELSHTHIDSIEKGMDFRTGKQVRVTTETVQKIARALNIDVDILSLLSLPSTADKFEFYYDYEERESMKMTANEVLISSQTSTYQKLNAAKQIFMAHYSRSIENCKFDVRHVSFDTFVSMLLNQKFWKEKLPADIYDLLLSEYGKTPGIPEGKTYYFIDESDESYNNFSNHSLIPNYTKHENNVIIAYRNQPEMQPAVDRLLGVEPEGSEYIEFAARGGKFRLDKETAARLSESAKKAPNSSQDRDMF